MVHTRQNNSPGDTRQEMPVKNTTMNEAASSSQPRGMSDKSAMDNDSDLEPLVRRSNPRTSWRRELRSRYSDNYGTLERVRRHPTRACRLRIVAPSLHSEDELLDDSDLPFNDEDEPIFSPVNTRRSYRQITRRIALRPQPAADERADINASGKLQNGVKEEDEDDLVEEEAEAGVRRSKRQRKLLYGSFNQSWILGTGAVLRGYPDMYGSDREAENAGNTSNSNDEGAPNDMPATANGGDAKANETNEEEDMYTKVKRTRRTRIRYSPTTDDLRPRLRPRDRRARTRVTVGDGSTESETGGSSDEESRRGQRRVYHLRQNKPIVERFQISSNEPPRRSSRLVLCSVRRRPYQHPRKRRDSSSSDEERFQRKKALSLAKARSRCMPLNYKPSETPAHQKTPIHSNKPVAGASGPKGPADVDPMAIDTSVTFEKVGGLEGHLRCLKEMVVFPMLYREVFDQFHVQPPKGILFHGPPGTGKTLIARALANECSQGDRKVAFFMRKGADCLSKWVGESERQLRLLFEQAFQMRPSIIFFDEIDGLAPVRSSKQDQIHASIVSTLLALLDGLDDRGDIIVIGATNRIDTIDPALRRPGRFDRELYFPLPGKKERIDILRIHTNPWTAPPSDSLIEDLAERSVGYCGSDLRLLCSEAVIGALRRRYPQVYRSSKKLLLQPSQVQVIDDDFRHAHTKIVPASCRVAACPRSRLTSLAASLLQAQFSAASDNIKRIFPPAAVTSVNDKLTRGVYKPRFILCGPSGQYGQTSHVAPALLDVMEHIPVHVLGLDTLLDTSNRSSEEAVIQIIREATRNPPSVIYLPAVDTWWDLLPPTTHRILLDRVAQISADAAVFLFATAHSCYAKIDPQIKSLFKYDYMELRKPTQLERSELFLPLLTLEPLREPPSPPVPEEEWEELPEAPAPMPPQPSAHVQEELHNAEEHRLRELRLFLREIGSKLARNRQFFMFTKPVDVKEVPDYLKIIKRPMDLETMMTNIDLHVYNSAQEFLADIDLIVTNALEYNPERDPEDKLIRHRACSLRDTAYTLIKAEMDTDFEEECRKISKKRREAKEKENKTDPSAQDKKEEVAPPVCNGASIPNSDLTAEEAKRRRLSAQGVKPSSSVLSAERIRRRKSNWARGMLTKKKSKARVEEGETEAYSAPSSALMYLESKDLATSSGASEASGKHRAASPGDREAKRCKSSTAVSPTASTTPTKQSPVSNGEEGTPKKRARRVSVRKLTIYSQPGVSVDMERLQELHQLATSISDGWTVEILLDCCARVRRILDNYAEKCDRYQLSQDLEAEIKMFAVSQRARQI